MPELDPKPRQTRGVSVGRWFLLLLPSALAIIIPLMLSVIRSVFGTPVVETAIPLAILSIPAGLVLCFEYGDRLEKWRHGEIRNGYRALGFGFLVLIVNAITALVGVGLVAMIFSK